jgi:hypothetical protein
MVLRKFPSRFRPYLAIVFFFSALVIAAVYFLYRPIPDIFSLYLNIISILMVVGLFAVNVPYNFAYYFCLATAMLSPFFCMLVWFTQKGFLGTPIPIAVILPVESIWVVAHRKTYRRNLFNMRFLESILIIFSLYTFGGNIAFSIPSITNQTATPDTMFIVGIGLFFIVSLQITNMAYRTILLNKNLNETNRLKLLERYRDKLKINVRKYDSQKVDFILYYLEPALEDFVFGDFEGSFENAFKIVFDREFDKIYRINNYRKRRKPFAGIRNTLAHARAWSADIKKVEDIKKVKSEIFDHSLNLLGIVKEFMDAIVS